VLEVDIGRDKPLCECPKIRRQLAERVRSVATNEYTCSLGWIGCDKTFVERFGDPLCGVFEGRGP
jgi:hypothetical protein